VFTLEKCALSPETLPLSFVSASFLFKTTPHSCLTLGEAVPLE
jgi:hypothetical protein